MNAQELGKRLKETVLLIEFTHYRTGAELSVRATLQPEFTGLNVCGHDPKSDIVAVWDLDLNSWNSIYISSITDIKEL